MAVDLAPLSPPASTPWRRRPTPSLSGAAGDHPAGQPPARSPRRSSAWPREAPAPRGATMRSTSKSRKVLFPPDRRRRRASRRRRQHVMVAERSPQPRHIHVDRLDRPGGSVLAPQRDGQALGAQGLFGMQKQHGKQPTGLGATQRDGTTVGAHLKRAEDSKLHCAFSRRYPEPTAAASPTTVLFARIGGGIQSKTQPAVHSHQTAPERPRWSPTRNGRTANSRRDTPLASAGTRCDSRVTSHRRRRQALALATTSSRVPRR
jgi:hypothetical protein